MPGIPMSEEDREKLNDLAVELLGPEWNDDEPFEQLVELIRRYGDPQAIREELQDFTEPDEDP